MACNQAHQASPRRDELSLPPVTCDEAAWMTTTLSANEAPKNKQLARSHPRMHLCTARAILCHLVNGPSRLCVSSVLVPNVDVVEVDFHTKSCRQNETGGDSFSNHSTSESSPHTEENFSKCVECRQKHFFQFVPCWTFKRSMQIEIKTCFISFYTSFSFTLGDFISQSSWFYFHTILKLKSWNVQFKLIYMNLLRDARAHLKLETAILK